MNSYSNFLLVFCMFWLLSGVFFVANSAAQDIRPGCDPEYMDALEAKSWLLAQRRITQNKNLILKPDSVLEYSCFDQYINFLVTNQEGRRFSENFPVYANWGVVDGITVSSLDTALDEIVIQPLTAYIDTNFPHTFLGGRVEEDPETFLVAGDYSCETMSFVWQAARCTNFMDAGTEERDALDGFYDFPFYVTNDPRRFPEDFPACEPDDRIEAAIIEAYRGEGQDGEHGEEWHQFVLEVDNDPVPAIEGTGDVLYEEDPILVEEILDIALPGACADSAVIPTGVYIEIPGQSDFEEFFCSMPSCSYDGGECIE